MTATRPDPVVPPPGISAFQVALHSENGEVKVTHRAFITEEEATTAARSWLNDEWRYATIQAGTWWSATPNAPAFFVAFQDREPLLVGELIPGTIEQTDPESSEMGQP